MLALEVGCGAWVESSGKDRAGIFHESWSGVYYYRGILLRVEGICDMGCNRLRMYSTNCTYLALA